MSTLAVERREPNKKLISFEEFFWLPDIIFKSVGWDLMETIKIKKQKYLLHVWCSVIIVLHVFVGYYTFKNAALILANANTDLYAIFRLLPYLCYFTDCNIKSLTFFLSLKRIRNIKRILQEIYPDTVAAQQDYGIHRYFMSKIVRVLIYFYLISCYALVLWPMVDCTLSYVYERFVLGEADAEFDYLKVYPGVTYFFDYRTPTGYILVVIIEQISVYFRIAINTSADVWLVLFVAQICMHLEHLARDLQTHEPTVENACQDNAFVGELIRTHQLLLSLHKELNAVFSVSLSFNLLSTIILLCASAVQLGHAVAAAAFNNKWYNGSQSYCKHMLLIILRAQRETSLVPKGADPISLETLKIVLSMTYRVFALLQTMME